MTPHKSKRFAGLLVALLLTACVTSAGFLLTRPRSHPIHARYVAVVPPVALVPAPAPSVDFTAPKPSAKHKSRHRVALPTSITVSGAGTSADNGVYTLSAGVDTNGNQYFQIGVSAHYIAFYPGATIWAIVTSLTGSAYPSTTEHYIGQVGDTATNITLTGWTRYSAGPASNPAPTLSVAVIRAGYSYSSPSNLTDHPPGMFVSGTPDSSGFLWDGSPGDTTTGYSAVSYSQSGVNYSILYGMLFFGYPATPVTATLTYEITGATSAASIALYSNGDTAPYTEYSSTTPATGTATVTLVGHVSPVWHWRLAVQWTGAVGTLRITDMRFYTGGGSEIISITPTGSPIGNRSVIDTLFSDSISRAAMTIPPRTVTDTLFSDRVTPIGSSLGLFTVTDTLFSDSESRAPMTFGSRVVLDALFADTEKRVNNVAPTGSTTAPIVGANDPLFTATETRSAMAFVRKVTDALFIDYFLQGVRSLGLRTVTDTLFSDSVGRTGVAHAIDPSQPDPRDPFQFVIQFLNTFNDLRDQTVIDSALIAVIDGWAAALQQANAAFTANRIAANAITITGGDGVSSTVYGTGSESFIAKVGPVNDAMALVASPDSQNERIYSQGFAAVTSWLNTTDGGGYSSVEVWMTARRALNSSLARFSPNTAKQYSLFNSGNGTLLFSTANVFAPQTNFASCTVGASGVITFVDGSNVPTANVVGPPAVQGYTPPTGVKANVTVTINGTLLITVTYNGFNAAGTAITAQAGTATLSSVTAGSSVTITPAHVGDRISDITACAKTGSPTATAGAFTLDSVLERVIV